MIVNFGDKVPVLGKQIFIADNAAIVGEVTLGEKTSVWFGACVRGDDAGVVIGDGSNVQDNATVHSGMGFPVMIGKNVTIGHNAIIHGCTIDDNVILGMGAIVMNGAHIGSGSIIGAGALIKEKAEIPENSLVVGAPGRIIRETSEEQRKFIGWNGDRYLFLAGEYANWEK